MFISMAKQFQDLYKVEDAEMHFKLSGSSYICFIPQLLREEDSGELMTLDLKLAPAPSKVTFKNDKASGEGENPDDTNTKPPA